MSCSQRSKAWCRVKLPTLCILLCLLCLPWLSSFGCSTTNTEPSVSAVEPQGTSLLLQVVDAQGSPVPGAVISSQNALFSVDSSGHRLFENLSPGRFFARVDALGFASATSVLELQEGAHVGAQVKLLPRPAPLLFQAEQGGILETEQVRLSIPPDAVVDSLGQPVTGSVDVTIVPLDPTLEQPAAPGPLKGISSVNGEQVTLESIFMAEVSLWHDGAPAQLAPGKSATLEFLLPAALAANFKEGDSVPAWWFDLDAGLWREEGAGTVQPSQTQPGRLAWVATVKHFTWWNADAIVPITGLSCANVLVLDANGNPVPYMPVSAFAWNGGDYTSVDIVRFTGLDGRTCTMIRRWWPTNIIIGSPGNPLAKVQTAGTEKAGCGMGSLCVDVTVTIPPIICAPGAYQPCAYSGPAGTEGVGQCQASRKLCNMTGTAWSDCQGEVLPTAEDCHSPFDDDCDGSVNEDADCLCPGQGSPCYGGPPATKGVGACHAGSVGCDPFGAVLCLGQQLPQMERCWTPEDDDCDGVVAPCYSGQWSPTGSLATARDFHTATLLPNGKVLVAGGWDYSMSGGIPIGLAELYDPMTGTWSATGSLASTRNGHTATLLPNGKVLVVGGPDATAELYDPATGTWSATGSLAGSRSQHTATLLPNNKVLVVGGPDATAELYDPATGTWSATGSLATSRRLHTATLLPNGKVLVAGGDAGGSNFDAGPTGILGTAEVYDPATGTWSATGSLLWGRSGHTATLLPNGKVLVAGGQRDGGLHETAELYDPVTSTWSPTGSLATARDFHTATLLPNGKVLVAGGSSIGILGTSELYDPATGTWSATGSLVAVRVRHTATLLPDGKVLAAGGTLIGEPVTAEVYTP